MTLDGALWFPAVDVADAIRHDRRKISATLLTTLDAAERRVLAHRELAPEFRVQVGMKAGRLMLVSESGLYKFILRAHPSNPAAKAFQDWVTQVVLPTIRKDGAYIMGEEKVALGELSAEDILDKLPTILGKKIRELEAVAQQWARQSGRGRTRFFAPSSIVTAAERADFPLSPWPDSSGHNYPLPLVTIW